MKRAWRTVALAAAMIGAVAAQAADLDGPRAWPRRAATRPDSTNEVDVLIARGHDLMMERQWTNAIAALKGALALSPNNEVARFGLSTACIKAGRHAEAAAVLEQLLKDYPENPAVRNNLAWVCARATDPKVRNPARAVGLAQEALIAAPADASIWGTLAEAYYASARYDRALRVARCALRIGDASRDPNLDEMQELYQRCRLAAGQTEPEGSPDEPADSTGP